MELSLIDGDEYEDGNATRQAFSRRGNKAEVTAEAIRKDMPNLYVWTTADYLTDDNVLMLIREEDVVFSCVDNHATRKLLADRCLELDDVLLISGGNEYTDGNIQLQYRKGGVDLMPHLGKYKSEIREPKDKNPGDSQEQRTGGCDARRVSQPQLLITNNMIAALMLNAFYAWTQGQFEKDNKDRYAEVYADILLNKTRPCPRS